MICKKKESENHLSLLERIKTCLMYIAVNLILRLVMSESDVMNFYSYGSYFYAVMGNEILTGLV